MASRSVSFPLAFASWGFLFFGDTLAQNCWRNTPCTGPETAAFPGAWESNMFAPASRTVHPKAAFDLDNGQSSLPDPVSLSREQSGVYYDFGLEVGGVVSIEFTVSSTDGEAALGLAFTEAKEWLGPGSDSSSGQYERDDGAVWANFSSTGEQTYTMPVERLRGGFRYLTLFLDGASSSVTIKSVSLEISFQPTWSNLRAYQGYFSSSDDLLNKIWYSGAYTLQTNAIHPQTGRPWPPPDSQWLNNATIGPGDTINTDGAKRDRTVWPGDMGVATPSSFYSTGDIESVKNSLAILYDLQAEDGLFPFSGPPLLAPNSDTYHMWTMIGTYNYAFYSGDLDFVQEHWTKYLAAMDFLSRQLDSSLGLLNITGYENDWGRFFVNSTLAPAQMLFYHTLVTGSTLATWLGDTTGLNTTWLQTAAEVRKAINVELWDNEFGAFDDSIEARDTNTGLHPQDGNSFAVLFGVVDAASDQAQKISTALTKNWTPIGAESPELPGEISPYISSFEIQAHLVAGQTQRALDLIRDSWGWYLNNENGTQSTMIEGYLIDGTFGYRHDAGYEEVYAYTSHAHGWATGPVTALTEHILGLSITGLAGSTWRLAPQFGDLTHAEGGFTSGLGKYSASWELSSAGGYTLEYNVPEGTSGVLVLPVYDQGKVCSVVIDGETVSTDLAKSIKAQGNLQVYTTKGTGGQHRIVVS